MWLSEPSVEEALSVSADQSQWGLDRCSAGLGANTWVSFIYCSGIKTVTMPTGCSEVSNEDHFDKGC